MEKPETFSLLLGVYCLNFVELCCSFHPGFTRPARRFNLTFKTFTLKCTDNRYSSVCGLRSVSEMFGIPEEDQGSDVVQNWEQKVELSQAHRGGKQTGAVKLKVLETSQHTSCLLSLSGCRTSVLALFSLSQFSPSVPLRCQMCQGDWRRAVDVCVVCVTAFLWACAEGEEDKYGAPAAAGRCQLPHLQPARAD